MITYDNGDWAGIAFVWAGSVWPAIKLKFILVTAYAVFTYVLSDIWNVTLGTEGKTILMSSMSFLLIFRANQAYTRYWRGRTMVGEYFSCAREFIMLSFGYIRGGAQTSVFRQHGGHAGKEMPADLFDQRASILRVDIVRLIVATGVALRMHTLIALDGYCYGSIDATTKIRLDWNRFQLRQLLTFEEFKLVDDCLGVAEVGFGWRCEPKEEDPLEYFRNLFRSRTSGTLEPPQDWPSEFKVECSRYPRPLTCAVHLAREMVFVHVNPSSNKQPWGIKERFVTELVVVLTHMEHSYDAINQIISTPLPLPYANLCKLLLSIFLFTMPFMIDCSLGWFANTIIPGTVSLALLGIDAIATELENPFGDDANDLDLLERAHQLESEAVELVRLSGDENCLKHFCWRPVPEFVKNASCRKLRYYLAVRDFGQGVQEGDPELSVEAFVELSRQFVR